MSVFSSLDEMVKNGMSRWAKIEQKKNEVKDQLDKNDVKVEDLAHLMVLLVEHFAPMNASQDSIDKAQKEISSIFGEMFKKR